jgi:hypothetical protein
MAMGFVIDRQVLPQTGGGAASTGTLDARRYLFSFSQPFRTDRLSYSHPSFTIAAERSYGNFSMSLSMGSFSSPDRMACSRVTDAQ